MKNFSQMQKIGYPSLSVRPAQVFGNCIGHSEKLVQRDIDSFFSPVFEAFSKASNPFIPFFWIVLPMLKISTGHTQQSSGQSPLDRSLVPCIYNAFQNPENFLCLLRIKQAHICKNDCRQASLPEGLPDFSGVRITSDQNRNIFGADFIAPNRAFGQKMFNLIGHIRTDSFPRHFHTGFLIFPPV